MRKFVRWFKRLFKEKEVENEERGNDNIDTDKPDDGGVYTPKPPTELFDAKELYYPAAIRYNEKMRTRGHYRNDYPKGAVVHFTAGRSRKREDGGSRAKRTHEEMGAKSVRSALKKNAYCYFVIDRDGGVHQAFSLDRNGYHAGRSRWRGLKSSVSNRMVGIEVQCAGKLKKASGDRYKAYFTNRKKGDKYFEQDEVRHISKSNENIQRGTYHKYSEKQEAALTKLIVWLKYNNPDVFNLDYVAGHDETSPDRKNDPGGSLSMTMPEFREHLKREYKLRY